MKEIIECKQCGKLFKPKRRHQRFCCERHRVAYHNQENRDRIQRAKELERKETERELGVFL